MNGPAIFPEIHTWHEDDKNESYKPLGMTRPGTCRGMDGNGSLPRVRYYFNQYYPVLSVTTGIDLHRTGNW